MNDEEDDDESEDDAGDVDEAEEEVEILVSFEEDGQEYHLVRLLDPVLLVGKVRNQSGLCILKINWSGRINQLTCCHRELQRRTNIVFSCFLLSSEDRGRKYQNTIDAGRVRLGHASTRGDVHELPG